MGDFTVVCLAFIAIGLPMISPFMYAAFKRYLEHKEKLAQADAERWRQRVQELERRIQALEDIVCSPDFLLFQEHMRHIRAEAAKQLPPPATQSLPTPAEKVTQRMKNA